LWFSSTARAAAIKGMSPTEIKRRRLDLMPRCRE
jgi:hypothetical protein